jgi:hypothetical protein
VDADEAVYAVYYFDNGASGWHLKNNVATNSQNAFAYFMTSGLTTSWKWQDPCKDASAHNITVDHLWYQSTKEPLNRCGQCGCVVQNSTVVEVPANESLPAVAKAIMEAAGAKPSSMKGMVLQEMVQETGRIPLKFDDCDDPVADLASVFVFGTARFTVLSEALVRLERLPHSGQGSFDDRASTVVINRRLPPVRPLNVSHRNNTIQIETAKLRITYFESVPASPSGDFSAANLEIVLKQSGTSWRPGQVDSANLNGTYMHLDCYVSSNSHPCPPVRPWCNPSRTLRKPCLLPPDFHQISTLR